MTTFFDDIKIGYSTRTSVEILNKHRVAGYNKVLFDPSSIDKVIDDLVKFKLDNRL